MPKVDVIKNGKVIMRNGKRLVNPYYPIENPNIIGGVTLSNALKKAGNVIKSPAVHNVAFFSLSAAGTYFVKKNIESFLDSSLSSPVAQKIPIVSTVTKIVPKVASYPVAIFATILARDISPKAQKSSAVLGGVAGIVLHEINSYLAKKALEAGAGDGSGSSGDQSSAIEISKITDKGEIKTGLFIIHNNKIYGGTVDQPKEIPLNLFPSVAKTLAKAGTFILLFFHTQQDFAVITKGFHDDIKKTLDKMNIAYNETDITPGIKSFMEKIK